MVVTDRPCAFRMDFHLSLEVQPHVGGFLATASFVVSDSKSNSVCLSEGVFNVNHVHALDTTEATSGVFAE